MNGKTKVHPHLKSFIHSVVMAEMATVGPSKSYLWKEKLMRQVQGNVLERLNEITNQTDLERVTQEEVQKLQVDFAKTLDMVQRTLQQVPLDVLRQTRPRQ